MVVRITVHLGECPPVDKVVGKHGAHGRGTLISAIAAGQMES